ncbi:MAG: hypothetical protein H6662_14335 [Ardenticatenaceae bacterium]|nr:hypothetical protein [Ardenticatenaceae bacterium]
MQNWLLFLSGKQRRKGNHAISSIGGGEGTAVSKVRPFPTTDQEEDSQTADSLHAYSVQMIHGMMPLIKNGRSA